MAGADLLVGVSLRAAVQRVSAGEGRGRARAGSAVGAGALSLMMTCVSAWMAGSQLCGEGLGISWPGQDLAIVVFGATFLATALTLAAMLRRPVRDMAR